MSKFIKEALGDINDFINLNTYVTSVPWFHQWTGHSDQKQAGELKRNGLVSK